MSDRVEVLQAVLREGAPEEAVLFQIMALLDSGSKQYGAVQHACVLALASSEYRGSLHRAWAEQSLLNVHEDWGVRIPHPKTTANHLPKYQSAEFREHHVYGLNPTELWRDINALLRDQLKAFVEVLGIKPHDWVVTIDTNVRPNYSKLANKAWKGHVVPQGLTPAAKFATPQFRQHSGKGVPLHDGTALGDEYMVCFAHHVRTGATFPVGVTDCMRVANNPAAAVTMLLNQLIGLPSPLGVLLDREFYATDVSDALNKACRSLSTMWMMPVRSSGRKAQPKRRNGPLSVPLTVKSAYPKSKPIPQDPNLRFYAEARVWPKNPTVPFNLVVFYHKKTLAYEPSPLDMDWPELGLPPNRYATAFITNFPIHPLLMHWLNNQYGRRWAVESAFSMLEHYFGYSPSKLLNSKFIVYGLNLVQYGLYNAWRFRASRELSLSMHHPFLGLAPYLTLLRRRLDLARFQ